MIDPARWFDAVGTCRCGKPATGYVRGTQNQSMGAYCTKCGLARIQKAARELEKANREKGK